ncbi:MAG: two-component system NtrC family nitrogen regulation sensor histidine kinase GlnL [Candidatus Saganbacteria bacterium]|uniref:Two-component system NtrC family nitrogen regulation sensor histidine kinase GlnL n=1 Tax=Candidatus Saganbacteria bacterium TaxID=2575572 RepID=A0A833L010_UNCSA|nr:MAG: two-component system NtrC family nitrogen regulation sensor histidine kinase GlnL [Candidatus Saganbacteria bacterium]
MFFYYVAYSLFLLFLSLKLSYGKLKNQIKYVFLGTAIGFFCGATNYFLWFDIPIPPILNIFVSVYTIFVPYAILRHRLLDVDIALSKLITYIIFLFSFGTLIFLALSATYKHFSNDIFLIFATGFFLSLLIAAKPFFEIIEEYVRKNILKTKYAYHEVLRELSLNVAAYINLKELSNFIVLSFTENIEVKSCALLVSERLPGYLEGFKYLVSASKGLSRDSNKLGFSIFNPFMKTIFKELKPLIKEDLENIISSPATHLTGKKEIIKIIREMEKVDAEVCIPCITKNKVKGIICIGAKNSNEIFVSEDFELFDLVSKQIAVALENAFLNEINNAAIVKQIKTSGKLITVYQELKDAQAGLIKAERTASISQMKTALLHEINNPLQFILPNLQLINKKLKSGEEITKEFLEKAISLAEEGTIRIREIMRRLDALEDQEAKIIDYVDGQKMIDLSGGK